MIELRGGILSRRWAPEIVLSLGGGLKRFNRLLEQLAPISDRILTVRLRELEDAGLLVRIVQAGPPISVEYALTGAGERYVPALRAVKDVERRLQELATA